MFSRSPITCIFKKQPSCLVSIEACSTSHFWARELTKLGHTVKLVPPNYVKAYVKRGKTDTADAQAICEAVRRPTMRFVPVKPSQTASLVISAPCPRTFDCSGIYKSRSTAIVRNP